MTGVFRAGTRRRSGSCGSRLSSRTLATSRSAKDLGPEDGLLTQDEEALVGRIERSKVWRLLRDSLCLDREELFSGNSGVPGLTGQPETNQAMWMQRGAILYIQHLLQGGPRLVVWYERHMADEREKKAREKGTVKKTEREYSPHPELQERPDDFDL